MKKQIITNRRLVQLGIAIVLCFLAFRFFYISVKFRYSGKRPFIVRVRVARDENKLKIGLKGACTILDAATGTALDKETDIPCGTEILPVSGGIKIGGKVFDAVAIRISPRNSLSSSSRDRSITLDGTLYRGEMDIIKKGGTLDAVNRVELEGYLKGVLPREINPFWPFAVMKAQAIASRSFAVAEALRRKDKEYDVTADTFSQVYGGASSERWRTGKAVDATKGKVLEDGGKVLPGYFHSCCGGHTEDISAVWGVRSEPLKGVKCRWCGWSPYFRWRVRVPTRTILEKLQENGYVLRSVDDIREGSRDGSQRLKYVRVRSRNKWFEINTGDFLDAIGRKVLRSANFRIKKYPQFYLFSGYGWGHGVGMCQWGAFGLALRKWKAERILEYYYPGAKIVDLREILVMRNE